MFNVLKKSAASAALLTGHVHAETLSQHANKKLAHKVNVDRDQLKSIGGKTLLHGKVYGVARTHKNSETHQ